MEMSDTIAKLAVALCKAQKEIKGAVKDSKNPFFKSDYADLSSVWDAIRVPLTSNGLSVTQLMDIAPDGVIIETVLLHESGEHISGKLFMKPVKNDPQGIGSAITYGRRYGLQAIAGVCPEDDDGNKASGNKGEDSPPLRETPVGEPPFKRILPPASGETQNFEFLKVMAKQKVRVGDSQYYNILGVHGFKHANKIMDRTLQETIFKILLDLPDKKEA